MCSHAARMASTIIFTLAANYLSRYAESMDEYLNLKERSRIEKIEADIESLDASLRELRIERRGILARARMRRLSYRNREIAA